MFAVFHRARKLIGRPVLVLAALWLAACQPAGLSDVTGAPSLRGGQPVPVALLVPHGAQDAQVQKLARDLENAARMAASDLQGVKVDLRVYGTADTPAKAAEAARNAVADGARIIVGPLRAETARAAGGAAAGRGVNVLAFSNNPEAAGGNVFILGQTFETTARRLTRFAVREGRERFLVLHARNEAGRLGRRAIETAVQRSGARVVGTVSYEFSQQAVIESVDRVRDAVSEGAPDTIFMTANSAGALPLYSQMLPEAGMGPPEIQYIGLSRWDKPPQTLELPGVQGGWFALPDPQRQARFRSRYESAYGAPPHEIAGLAYDGIAAVGALAKQGRRDALSRDSLTQSAGFQGVSGVFRFHPDGTNDRGLAVATIRDNAVKVLAPAPQSFSGTGF
ncbi:penicillin-binding protein activator [Roseovarius salinarum]|uniref:penicillin-binding protein activator n=1 Tax=Roseovarius salinarum TaxID=1981892 RepID=UPI000C32B90D|nr:penicillin-binding protein activator [Roseovarius salinarum]